MKQLVWALLKPKNQHPKGNTCSGAKSRAWAGDRAGPLGEGAHVGSTVHACPPLGKILKGQPRKQRLPRATFYLSAGSSRSTFLIPFGIHRFEQPVRPRAGH